MGVGGERGPNKKGGEGGQTKNPKFNKLWGLLLGTGE